MWRGPALSAACHMAVLAALIATVLPLPVAPTEPPSVELVIGSGADVTGTSQPPPGPPAAEPAAPSPLASQTSAPPLDPAQAVPPEIAATPTIVPAPPSRPQPSQAAPSPAPPPTPSFAAPAQASMDVRLGSGIAAPIAEIEDTGLVHPAEAETGNLPPDYPPEAARRHEHGTVTLGVRVSPDGSVREVRVLSSSGSRALDNTARERIATWHFHPATRDGKPVGDIVEIPVNFIE